MAILTQTTPNGTLVTKNATYLDTALTDSDTDGSLDLNDDDVFAINTYAIIDAETVKITDADDSSDRDITREQSDHNSNATSATAHESGAWVRLQGGATELLTYEFDGSTYFAGFNIRSERGFWWSLEVDSTIVDTGFVDSSVPFYTEVRPRSTPAAGTWKILVWASETRVFHGKIFN